MKKNNFQIDTIKKVIGKPTYKREKRTRIQHTTRFSTFYKRTIQQQKIQHKSSRDQQITIGNLLGKPKNEIN